jgi:hypothetical protein
VRPPVSPRRSSSHGTCSDSPVRVRCDRPTAPPRPDSVHRAAIGNGGTEHDPPDYGEEPKRYEVCATASTNNEDYWGFGSTRGVTAWAGSRSQLSPALIGIYGLAHGAMGVLVRPPGICGRSERSAVS